MTSIKEVICSLIDALIAYHGRKGTHIKKKNEIAKKLLLTAAQTYGIIQRDSSFGFRECVILYSTLIASRNALLMLKANNEGELDALIEVHIKKWELAFLQKTKDETIL